MRLVFAPPIAADSWLNEDQHAEFRWAYGYAATQSRAIPGLAKLDPEEAYFIWTAFRRAAEHHARIEADPVASPRQRFSTEENNDA